MGARDWGLEELLTSSTQEKTHAPVSGEAGQQLPSSHTSSTTLLASATLLLDTSAPRMGGKGDFYIIQYIVSGDAERKGGWKKQGAHEGLTQ